MDLRAVVGVDDAPATAAGVVEVVADLSVAAVVPMFVLFVVESETPVN